MVRSDQLYHGIWLWILYNLGRLPIRIYKLVVITNCQYRYLRTGTSSYDAFPVQSENITCDVTWASWRLKSMATRLFIPQIVQANGKESSNNPPHYWHFVMGIHRPPMDSSLEKPIMRKAFPSNDVIMFTNHWDMTNMKQVRLVPRNEHTFRSLFVLLWLSGIFHHLRPLLRTRINFNFSMEKSVHPL